MLWYQIHFKNKNGDEKSEMVLVVQGRITRDVSLPGVKTWFPCGTPWTQVAEILRQEEGCRVRGIGQVI